MKTDPLLRLLASLRWRIVLQRSASAAARLALLAGGVVVVVAAAGQSSRLPLEWPFAQIAGAVLTLAVLATFLRRPNLAQVAARLDQLGGTRDRLTTALALAGDAAPWPVAARAECLAWLKQNDLRRALPWRWPHEIKWLLVPAIALLFLHWNAVQERDARLAREAAALAAADKTAEPLRKLADEAKKIADAHEDAELKRLAEKIRESAERLRAKAPKTQDAEKAALAELARLTEELRLSKAAGQPPTPEELKALAAAMKQSEPLQDAAKSIEQGKLAEAAKKLEEARQQMNQPGAEPSREQAEKTLQKAADALAKSKERSQAASQIAQAMQDALAKNQDAAQALAEALEKLGQQQSQQPQRGQDGQQQQQQRQATIEEMLSAIEALKNGQGSLSLSDQPGGEPNGEGQPGQGKPQISMQNFGQPDRPGEGEKGLPIPSGKPGSENDTGTTEHPFGAKGERTAKANDTALRGRLGTGESLQMLAPSTAQGGKSTRRYREIFDAMAPDAEEAARNEEIPLGSRYFIRRYFESIRPKE